MMCKKISIEEFYSSFFSTRELCDGGAFAREYIEQALEVGINAFDQNIIKEYEHDPHFVEKSILEAIFIEMNIAFDTEYLSYYAQEMNVFSSNYGQDIAIIMDELLLFTMNSFILTICSMNYDNSKENLTRCIKNSIVLLDLQGCKHTIGTHNIQDFTKMLFLPENVIHTAEDIFWSIWTFIVGHELYHLTHPSDKGVQAELNADRYGYQVLMTLILAQKQKKLSPDVDCFNERCYLTPVMLMEYYKMLDSYQELLGKSIIYKDYPSPEERQKQIFDLFEMAVPDSLNTEEGNELLNIFLEGTEWMMNQIKIKKQLGKLECIGNINQQ